MRYNRVLSGYRRGSTDLSGLGAGIDSPEQRAIVFRYRSVLFPVVHGPAGREFGRNAEWL